AARPPRHAEGRERGAELALLAEQLSIGRVGARVAALDVVDADVVEQAGDRKLVVEGEVDAVGLRAVAQRGVEEIEAFARGTGHCGRSFAASCFSMVVLASHSPPSGTVLRCCGTNPRFLKKSCALSLTSAVSRRAPRAPASFSSASTIIEPTPWPAALG